MGLGDCFSIQSDHALQLPPRTQPKKADPPCVADRPKAIYSSMEKAQSEAELEQIADVFFRGRTFILSKSSGDLTQERLRAMREILKSVRQLVQRYGAKANDDSLDVSQGKLNYCYQTTDTTCYDGGSYGDWLNQLYLGVEIMDDEALRAAKENAKKDPISGFTQRFRTDHPECGAGTTRFVDHENVYMIHPFDTAINLRFSFFAQ